MSVDGVSDDHLLRERIEEEKQWEKYSVGNLEKATFVDLGALKTTVARLATVITLEGQCDDHWKYGDEHTGEFLKYKVLAADEALWALCFLSDIVDTITRGQVKLNDHFKQLRDWIKETKEWGRL